MAYTLIDTTPIQLQKNAAGNSASGYYLKLYAAGTTTPISMYTTSTGSGALAKCQIDSEGFAINGSGDPFIPYVNQTYKIVVYTNETDADEDTFASAFLTVDNIPQVSGSPGYGDKPYDMTLAEFKASTLLVAGDVVVISDRANGIFDIASGVSGANTYNVIANTAGTLKATLRTTGELIFTKHFGVKDGVDSTAALQAAIDYAESLNTGGGYGYEFTPTVVLPPGRMIITAEIALDDTKHIAIHGAGMTATVFDCSTSAAFRSVFYSGASQSTFNRFKGFAIHGGGDIQYGIYGPFVDHVNYTDVRVSGTTVAGVYHKYGWSSTFDRCELAYNSGHGLVLEDNSNAVSVMNCQIYQNTGFGVWVNQSHGVKIIGGAIENNTQGGLMLNLVDGYFVSTYMEGNGNTGYTYTTPAVTVKAQVILNESGTPTTNLAAAGGTNGTFAGMNSSLHADNTCVVYAASCDALKVDGWHVDDDPLAGSIPFLRTLVSSSYAAANEVYLDNIVTTSGNVKVRVECSDYTVPVTSTWADTHSYSDIPKFDLGATHGANPATYSNLSASSTALTIAALTTYRNGILLYSSTQTGSGSSHIYGYTLPSTDIEDFDDAMIYITCWVKAVTGTPGFGLYADTGSGSILSAGSSSALTNGVWTKRTAVFKGNGSGTIKIGLRQFNGNASDVVHFTRPVVSVVGVHSKHYGVAA